MTQDQTTQASMYCRKCGYQLVGLSEHRCPECGQTFDPTQRRTFFRYPLAYQIRRWTRRTAVVLATALLLWTVVVVCSSGWIYWQYHADWQTEQQAIATLTASPTAPTDMFAYYDTRNESSSLLCRLAMPMSYLRRRVQGIEILDSPQPTMDLSVLATFKQCKKVSLAKASISDDQLRPLAAMTQLTILYLSSNPEVTDRGLAYLKGLTSLTNLDLWGTGVSGAGLQSLRQMRRLQYLRLSNTRVHGRDLADLKVLPSLDTLALDDLPITDSDLQHVKVLPLRRLVLRGTHVTDAGLEELGKMVSLNELELCDTSITDAGLRHLKGLSNLRRLFVERTKVTEHGVQQLEQSLPSLRVYGP